MKGRIMEHDERLKAIEDRLSVIELDIKKLFKSTKTGELSQVEGPLKEPTIIPENSVRKQALQRIEKLKKEAEVISANKPSSDEKKIHEEIRKVVPKKDTRQKEAPLWENDSFDSALLKNLRVSQEPVKEKQNKQDLKEQKAVFSSQSTEEPNLKVKPVTKNWFTIEKALPVGFMAMIVLGLVWILRVVNATGLISNGVKLGFFYILSIVLHGVTEKKIKNKKLIQNLLYGLVFTIGILTTFVGVLGYKNLPMGIGIGVVFCYLAYGYAMSYREKFQPLSIFIALSALLLPYLLANIEVSPVLIYLYILMIYAVTTALTLKHQQMVADTVKTIFSVLSVVILLINYPGGALIGRLLLGLFLISTLAYWPYFKEKKTTTGFIFSQAVIFMLFCGTSYRVLECLILAGVLLLVYYYYRQSKRMAFEISSGVGTLLAIHLVMDGPLTAVLAVILGLYIAMRFEIMTTFFLTLLAYTGNLIKYIVFPSGQLLLIQFAFAIGSLLLVVAYYYHLQQGKLVWAKERVTFKSFEWSTLHHELLLKGLPAYLLLVFYRVFSQVNFGYVIEPLLFWSASLVIMSLSIKIVERIDTAPVLLVLWIINIRYFFLISTWDTALVSSLVILNVTVAGCLMYQRKVPSGFVKRQEILDIILFFMGMFSLINIIERTIGPLRLSTVNLKSDSIVLTLLPLFCWTGVLVGLAYGVTKLGLKRLLSVILLTIMSLDGLMLWVESGLTQWQYLAYILVVVYALVVAFNNGLRKTFWLSILLYMILTMRQIYNYYEFDNGSLQLIVSVLSGILIYMLYRSKKSEPSKVAFISGILTPYNWLILGAIWWISLYQLLYNFVSNYSIVYSLGAILTIIALVVKSTRFKKVRSYFLFAQLYACVMGLYVAVTSVKDFGEPPMGSVILMFLLLAITVIYSFQLDKGEWVKSEKYMNRERQLILLYAIDLVLIRQVLTHSVSSADGIVSPLVPMIGLIVYASISAIIATTKSYKKYQMISFIVLILLLLYLVFVTFAYIPTIIKGLITIGIGILGFGLSMKVTKTDK
ncbi:hypothetical protein OL233_10485 [Vagococcus sp. PNs007]|uniref:DUF2339 domain-containing protein n=1 Tax=Vagococcus proximus TaxID=2991417 RepID=A0ABT5X3X3_9ENTE|nr:hypothetical protein [Vagococcus proximus]MDF0480707.1 hypothetical protein [Vagococcus proximus]